MAPYSYEGVEPAPSPAFSSSISLSIPPPIFLAKEKVPLVRVMVLR